MSWFSGFGSGGAAPSTDVGMTGMSGTTESVPEAGSGAEPGGWKKFAKEAGEQLGKGGGAAGSSGTGSGGSGSTLSAKRPIGEHPEAPAITPENTPARSGFARLAEIPGRQRSYGTT